MLNIIYQILLIIIFIVGLYRIVSLAVDQFILWIQTKKLEEMTPTEPEIDELQVVNGYDVNAFRKRMDEFKKEYYEGVPLYDVPVFEAKPDDEITGVEVITDDYEVFMERKMK
jgi:hypothetical protein